MKIGILTITSPDEGGGYQYTLSLLEALSLHLDKFEYVQIRYPDFPKVLDNDIVINKRKSSMGLKVKRLLHAYAGINIGDISGFPKEKFAEIDLIISPTITLFPCHMKKPYKPYIVTIHDFQHEYYSEFFSFREMISRKIGYTTAKFAEVVIVESKHVKNDVIKFLGVDERKVKVILSPPPSYLTEISLTEKDINKVRKKYSLPNRYLFYPAQFWYHKNHINLLIALHFIKQQHGEGIPLIFTGSKKNNFENVMRRIDELGMQKQVKYLGYVPGEDMPYLYKLSTTLVMPTLFESVSLPIWEAFYLGVPIASSNVCALPEQVGDAGLLFDPHNIKDMAEKIYRVWTDRNLRKKLIKKGYERLKDLTLENYAKQWKETIDEVLDKI